MVLLNTWDTVITFCLNFLILDQRNFISSISIPSPNCSVVYIAHVSGSYSWGLSTHLNGMFRATYELCNILLIKEYAFPNTHALRDSLYNPHQKGLFSYTSSTAWSSKLYH